MSLKPGMKVLDVGSGLGGAAMYLAQVLFSFMLLPFMLLSVSGVWCVRH